MSKYEEVVKTDTPRLEVRYRCVDGRDEFEWGHGGNPPLLALLGDITRAQIELHSSSEYLDDANRCPEKKFVLVPSGNNLPPNWFVHHEIPIGSLMGILETIKSAIVLSFAARRAVAQSQVALVGPDGKPIIH